MDQESIKTPYNIEAEEALLGSIFIYPDVLSELMEIVNANDFYKNNYKLIFSEMIEIFKTTTIIDSLVLLNSLRKKGILDQVGGEQIIYDLTDVVPTAANAKTYAKIVRDNAIQRKLIDTGTKITEMAYRGYDSIELMQQKAELMLFNISKGQFESDTRTSAELIKDFKSSNENNLKISTPYEKLNNNDVNFHQGELMVIGARPSMGKTAFALNLLRLLSERGNKTVFVNLEMKPFDILSRIMSAALNVPLKVTKIDNKKNIPEILQEPYQKFLEEFSGYNYNQIDVDDYNFNNITAKISKLLRQEHKDIVVIDYLQQMSCDGHQNMTYSIQHMLKELKSLARKYKTCIVVLSQINREGDTAPSKTNKNDNKNEIKEEVLPTMKNLKDSGFIEQVADGILLLHRPDYGSYGMNELQLAEKKLNVINVIIAKNRNGATGKIDLFYNKDTQRIYE